MLKLKRRNWRNKVLIEGPKEAMVISQMEGFPEPDSGFDDYPVDLTLPKKLTFWEAVKKSVKLGERCLYNIVYKEEK